jgi:hypothetical protein
MDNPILKFAQKGSTGGTSTSLPTQSGSNPLLDFAGRSNQDTGVTNTSFGGTALPRNVDEARNLQENNPTLWQKISKELMKPIGLVAQATESTGNVIGDLIAGDLHSAKEDLFAAPGKLGGIITGTRTNSFSDLWQRNSDILKIDDNGGKNFGAAFLNDFIPRFMGTLTDLTADPLNYIGGGLTKAGQLSSKATALTKAGQVIAADSKFARAIKSFGLTEDMLKLAPTKAEQVAKGQRALLTIFGNTRWEKTLIGGAPIYETASKIANGFNMTKTGQVIAKVFSSKTSNEAFNATREHFTNLLEYRNGQVMGEAMDIQNKVAKMTADEARQAINVVETGVKSGVAHIDDLAAQLSKNFDTIKSAEQSRGLLKTDVAEYFPHQLAKGDVTKMSEWQKFKSGFMDANNVPIDEAVNSFGSSKQFSTKQVFTKGRKYEGTIEEIRKNFGIDFEAKPAIGYAKRALSSAKAVTSSEFFDSVKQFGTEVASDAAVVGKEMWQATKVPELKNMKFSPDVARQIDAYYTKIKPEEMSKALRVVDSVQNWWKAQALTAPSYHIRNMVGNIWNNFLGGVVNPDSYYKAGLLQSGKGFEFTDDAGRIWNEQRILDAAKKSGVINEGWYAKDIDTAVSSELGGISWNPLKQNFALFRANRAAGSVLENNSRLAHFIEKIKGGDTIDNAASSVKKYLFDYGDLTFTEQNIFKRAVPFYTWTRKNIPLQLEALLTQPGKFATVPKAIDAVQSGVEKPNEKYLGDYIKDNVGVRVGKDGKGNTMYFLLGNWLPAAQAIDFLSQPVDNFIQSVSPFVKTPIELWANQSSFFTDTFGQPSQIERYPQENQSWLGLTMRKKTAYILKNVRILNELDKLNPGSIWGDKNNPSLWNRIAPDAGVSLPGVGKITTSEKRFGKYTPEGTTADRIIENMFGKTTVYNPNYAKQFYLWDTNTKVAELKKALKNAQVEGQSSYAKRLAEELQTTLKERNK